MAIRHKKPAVTPNRATLVDYLEMLLRGWKQHDAKPEDSIKYIVDTYGQDFGLQADVELRKSALTSKLTFAPNGSGRLVIEDDQVAKMYALAKLNVHVTPRSREDLRPVAPKGSHRSTLTRAAQGGVMKVEVCAAAPAP